jgi:hypothetical protein
VSKWRALQAAPRDCRNRAGRSRTCLKPRIRRLPHRPVPGPHKQFGRAPSPIPRPKRSAQPSKPEAQAKDWTVARNRVDHLRLRVRLEWLTSPAGQADQRKGQELNLQGLAPRLLSKQMPSPIGLPFLWDGLGRPSGDKRTPARNRTWNCSLGGSHDVRFTTRAISARRESNPPVRFGRPMPRPLGHGHKRKRKERESNPQGLDEASPGFEPGAIANWLALPFQKS